MLITFLVVVFIVVFGFLAWRIIMNSATDKSKPEEAYICPVCNEKHCVCDRKQNT